MRIAVRPFQEKGNGSTASGHEKRHRQKKKEKIGTMTIAVGGRKCLGFSHRRKKRQCLVAEAVAVVKRLTNAPRSLEAIHPELRRPNDFGERLVKWELDSIEKFEAHY